ncbi:fused response regulator/phosphatase [Magnetococcus sp. PR-3]|uniref:fused response regulator/phosphatase n=1 Tax=Magnetococcus sp. PR-3 TaxID=3120355 RepID=UPI002FCE682E
MKKILIVEDDLDNRQLLNRYLTWEGYQAIEATNGHEGIAAFKQHRPDLVLMDLKMPLMDGLQAAREIKEITQEQFVPILFITASDDDEQVSIQCLEAGGDDFLNKPFTRTALRVRLQAWDRVHRLNHRLLKQRNQLMNEQALLSQTLSHLHGRMEQDLTNLRYYSNAEENHTTDLLFSARRADGVRHILLGDIAGQGLSVAVGTPLIADIFHEMTEKGFAASIILMEMRRKLAHRLPQHMPLHACFMEEDPLRQQITLWNCGMPPLFMIRDGEIIQTIPSNCPILGEENTTTPPQALGGVVLPTAQGDRLFAHSNGLFDRLDIAGEIQRNRWLEQQLLQLRQQDQSLLVLKDTLEKVTHQPMHWDDITLMELLF